MQVIRRSAFRAVNSVSTPVSFQARTPFVLRQNAQPLTSQLFRRFASNDADKESTPNSADSESSSIKAAIDSVTKTASETADGISTYAGQAAESVQQNYNSAKESVVDGARAAGAAAGFSAPRHEARGSRGQDYGGARSEYELEPTDSIYVGNLLFDTTSEALQAEFSAFSPVSAKIATDDRGLSKGFAYVQFTSVADATAAIAAKNQEVVDGRRIIVNYQNKTKRERPTENSPSSTIFIGNLAFEMTDADLNALFKDVKNVIDVRVAIDRRTGQPRGFAHAEFTDVESAIDAVEYLKDKEAFGRKLRIDFSVSKPAPGQQTERFGDRPQRGSFGGRGRGGRGGRGGYGGRGDSYGGGRSERY